MLCHVRGICQLSFNIQHSRCYSHERFSSCGAYFCCCQMHGEDCLHSAWVLFVNMSAAFQAIQHVLIQRLLDLDINSDLVLWIRQFLRDRPHRVSLNARMLFKPVLSDEIVVNTGAPQGCVLSPVLFSLYTNDIRCHDPTLTLLKFTDNIVLVGCLKDEFSISQYFLQTDVLNTMLKTVFSNKM